MNIWIETSQMAQRLFVINYYNYFTPLVLLATSSAFRIASLSPAKAVRTSALPFFSALWATFSALYVAWLGSDWAVSPSKHRSAFPAYKVRRGTGGVISPSPSVPPSGLSQAKMLS